MSWDLHHSESERLAQAAQTALAAGDRQGAHDLYRRAAECEERALAELDPAKSRTRGITAVSALSLWLKGARHETVLHRGEELLRDDSLPHFARTQIREILQSATQGRDSQDRYEVEITFRQTLRYAVYAQDRKAAEKQALSLWKVGNDANVLASDACEVLEVQTHAPSGADRVEKDAAEAYRYLRDRELVIETLDEDAFNPGVHDAVSAEEVALRLGWKRANGLTDIPRAARALDRLSSERRIVRFVRNRTRAGEKGQVYLYCTPQHLAVLSAMIMDEEISQAESSSSTAGREMVLHFG
jgi:hypothetical protein